uniref:Uncharacterized protein n=1 Tax=Ignisphaera aggregans TaxID=334771 RepID=A0A7C2VLN7_9CREN
MTGDSIESMENELQSKLGSIREELQKLILERDSIRSELRITRDKINEEITKLRKLKEDMRKSRDELNNLYSSLQTLKKEIASIREKLRNLTEQRRKLLSEIKKRTAIRNEESIDSIKEEIERLEWKLITTPNLDLDEEKKIVERIAALEKKLKELTLIQKDSYESYHKYEELSSEIDRLRNELKSKIDTANRIRESIAQLKELRNNMKKDIETIVKTLSELKKQREELKSRLQAVVSSITSKSEEYRNIMKELNRLKELQESRKLNAFVNRKKEDVKKKLERGERVSFNELYLMFMNEEGSA